MAKLTKLQLGNEVLGYLDVDCVVAVLKHQNLNTSVVLLSHGNAIGNFIVTGHPTHDVVKEIESLRNKPSLAPSDN